MMGQQSGDQSRLFYLFNLERRIPDPSIPRSCSAHRLRIRARVWAAKMVARRVALPAAEPTMRPRIYPRHFLAL